jgi:anaerobic ribonucleoside-triphosphate reductase
MCPLTGDTNVRFKCDGGIWLGNIKNICELIEHGSEVKVEYNKRWYRCKPVKTQMTRVFELELSNGTVVKMGENHLQPTISNGTLMCKHLGIGMYLPYENESAYAITRITDISEYVTDEYLYCFEVDNEDHLFTLGNGLVTHNCRLSLDLDEIREVASGIWDKGANTGSLAICTINLNRLGIEAFDYQDYEVRLLMAVDKCTRQLIQRKDYVMYAFENGLMPYTKEYIGRLDTFFLTVGVCGAWEAYVNLCRSTGDSVDIIGYETFCEDTLKIIKGITKDNSSSTDWKLWNVEQTPAEGTAHRFARADRKLYPNASVSGEGDDCYLTNSTHIPVNSDVDIAAELKFRAKVDRMYTGGTLFNYYSDTKASPESVRKLMHNMCKKTALPYIAYTPSFGTCDKHGLTYGSDKCLTCGETIPYYSRVVGYYRSTDRFNNGQKQQFDERKYHSDK